MVVQYHSRVLETNLSVGFFVDFHHSVDDWDISVFDLEHHDLSYSNRGVLVIQK